MANLLKRGARTPRVTKGYVYTACNYANEEHERGVMPPMLYKLTVGNRNGTGAAQFKSEEHTLELTEHEMLETVAEWMKLYAGHRLEERKRNAT